MKIRNENIKLPIDYQNLFEELRLEIEEWRINEKQINLLSKKIAECFSDDEIKIVIV